MPQILRKLGIGQPGTASCWEFGTVLRCHSPIAVALFAVILSFAHPAAAADATAAVDTAAREAYLMDFETGQVLFAKNPDDLMPPASMTKMMTVYLAFERLKDGRLRLADEIPVSEKAWRMGGSKMFIKVGTSVSIKDILQGIIVQSGNDATVALGEALAGSEAAFADMMTEKARELGMANTTFRNASGWPDPEHRTTAHDLALLAASIIRRFPEFYPLFSELTFTYNGIKQGNRNPLLYKNMDVDGLKTGHTENAGYGLTASAMRGTRRLVLVLNGMRSVQERSDESARLMEWGFREFENVTLAKQGTPVETAEVWLGDRAKVPLVADRDLMIAVRRAGRRGMTVTVEYAGPIPAPIAAGQPIAMLRVAAPEMEDRTFPLYAGVEVGQLGPLGRITSALGHLIWGAGG